jgi:pimeloyl-ACP methyl ester carboxylesterase
VPEAIASDASPVARVVKSKDGTSVSFLTVGHGPSVIAIPGALSTASDYLAFADRLGRTHAVHILERRGRGLSGPQGTHYSMAKECEDVAAVIEATGARLLFGHSYGGLIALESASRDASISKVAAYEPGVSIDGAIATSWTEPCERSLERGKRLDAFAIFSIGAGPKRARMMPVWLMKFFLPRMIPRQRLAKLLELLPTTLAEHRVIAESDGAGDRYRSLSADVLLMFGGKTQADWVRLTTTRLSREIPSVDTHCFAKLDHFGPDQGGPAEVSDRVAAYFGDRAGDYRGPEVP